MSLKKLSQFLYFDIDEFLEKKQLQAIGISEWKDYTTQELKGSKVEAVIISDKTNYYCAEGEIISNLYEKLIIKVPKKIEIPMNSEVGLVNPIATVYGEFRNALSIVADDIKVIGK